MTDLKPCPFCGGEAALVPTLDTTVREWFVTCGNLECSVLSCRTKRYYTEAEAIAAWNARAERTCCDVSLDSSEQFYCSECECTVDVPLLWGAVNFCPNCGARVIGMEACE